MTTSNRLFGKISTIYMVTAQNQFLGYCASIILILRISQLFKYYVSTNYLTTGNRLHNCLPCIEKLYHNFKSPIWKHINIYMATAQNTIFWLLRIYHLATAHHPIIFLLQIDQLFHHWKSSKYLITEHRKIV